jgi:uncharacterized protein
MIRKYAEGKNIERWLAGLEKKEENEVINIKDYGQFTLSKVRHYYKKFLLLLENRYFHERDIIHRLSKGITPDEVEESLANISQITFEVTEQCNLNCHYCGYGQFYSNFDKRTKRKLEVGVAKKILDYFASKLNSNRNLSKSKILSIGFYGGEPLLNFPFISEIVNYTKQLKLFQNTIQYTITTNGLLLQKHMDFLVENRFNTLISLDGGRKNNEYRRYKNGKPAYDIILDNVKAFREKYPDFFREHVNFNSVLHNKNSMDEIHSYFKNNFRKSPSVSEIKATGIVESKSQEFYTAYANIQESLFKSENYSSIERDMFIKLPNIQSIAYFLHHFSNYVFNDYNDLRFELDKFPRLPTATCHPFQKKVFITATGKILPCERIGHQFALGAANNKKVHIDTENIAGLYNKFFEKMRKLCHKCYNSESCLQCIFNLDIESDNPKCKAFMSATDFSKFLASHISYLEKKPDIYSRIMKRVVME